MTSELIHRSRLDIDTDAEGYRKTSIVGTIGPACNDEDTILEMIKSGMNIARLNLSHGTHKEHTELIKMIRGLNLSLPPPFLQVAIALDLRGPEIRTGSFADGSDVIELHQGDIVTLSTNENNKDKQTKSLIWVDYPEIVNQTDIGCHVYIDDGSLGMVVVDKGFDSLVCEVGNNSHLGVSKGVNLPGVRLKLPAVSEQDKLDIEFAIKQGADMVLASYVCDGDDVRAVRKAMGEDCGRMQLLAKIENHRSIKNINSIIEAADGIFVARGDLGIEIAPEKVFLAQKMIISKCNRAGKPVICGTQMLESMTNKPRPTRAEAGDVANAVLDGADCVMLSGETARGKFPVTCVQIMDKICKEAECSLYYKKMFEDLRSFAISSQMDRVAATAVSAVEASFGVNAAAIVTLTMHGTTAACVAQLRPQCVTMAVTRCSQSARQMHLNRGIMPIFYPYDFDPDGPLPWLEDVENRVNYAIRFGKQCNIIKKSLFCCFNN